jgi:hypothetical protein
MRAAVIDAIGCPPHAQKISDPSPASDRQVVISSFPEITVHLRPSAFHIPIGWEPIGAR